MSEETSPAGSQTAKIGLLGLGTVGSGLVRLLEENEQIIGQRTGAVLQVARVLVRDVEKERAISVDRALLTTEISEIIDDDEIDVIVELIGGTEPARSYVLQALRAGKSVVTANKEIMSEFGREIFETAERNNVDIAFEGSVGGGIPIIGPLKESLAGNRITKIHGILNGTTNYVLTRMSREGLSYEEALAEAQEKGYAEADPSADVDGDDAARKLAILAAIAFGTRIHTEQIFVEGIRGITALDIRYAREMDKVIKLLAIGEERENKIELRVHPAMIDRRSPLASVHDNYNAVLIDGSPVEQAMFYGPGAGGGPTASAVAGDVIDVVRNRFKGTNGLYCTCYNELAVRERRDFMSHYYLRLQLLDAPGVLSQVADRFGKNDISLHTVIQKRVGEDPEHGHWAEMVLVTHRSREADVLQVADEMEKMDAVFAVENIIRVIE